MDIYFPMTDQARKTETSLMKLRQGAQKRNAAGGGASTDAADSNVSTDKICMQLFLDIQVRISSPPLSLSLISLDPLR